MRVVERMKCHTLPTKQISGIKEEAFCLSTVTALALDFDAVGVGGGGQESLASVFQALAADTYALDLVINAILQRDMLLIKLSSPPPTTPPPPFGAEQVPFSARTVHLANLH